MNGMTKSQIDLYISNNYKLFLKAAKGLTYKNQRNYDPKILITEAYLHILNMSDRIKDESDVQRFMFAKIHMESRFNKSTTNLFYSERNLNIDDIQINHQSTNYELNEIDVYLIQEKDTVLKVVADAYIIKQNNTVRKLKDYFGISDRAASMYIKLIKEKIRTHEEI